MKYLFALIIAAFALSASAQTHGALSFSVKTVTYTAQFAPRHILAIWIANGSGQWVKTRKRIYANTAYRQYLTNFKSATSSTFNATDATTGATLSAHTTHTITWDGRDVSGNLVADGTYRVYIEFTSANATGKLYYCEFTKGPDAVTLTPANQTNFTNISLIWTPVPAAAPSINSNDNGSITCFPNPFNESLNISVENNEIKPINVVVYDISGKVVKNYNNVSGDEKTIITWDGNYNNGEMASAGIYYISVQSGSLKKTIKVVKR